MSSLEMFITEYLAKTAGIYFVRQVIVILVLFVFGAVLSDALGGRYMPALKRCLAAFPVGAGAFAVTAYVMLVVGIPYNACTVISAAVLETAAAVILRRKSFAENIKGDCLKHMITAAVIVLLVAAFATSGLAPVSISNDTMYYFKRYPESIVYYGALRDQFDAFLTDTGLGAVCIDTLPSLFGFGETFGIREFFHIDFIAFFGICVYERSKGHLTGKGPVIAALVATAFLAVATPFVILGHWALANMYYMELFFIAAYTLYDRECSRAGAGYVMLLALSLLRIEGTVFALWLALAVTLTSDIAKRLAVSVILPMTLLFGGYSFKLFKQFYVYDDIYLFLTPQKAAFLTGAMAVTGIYLYFVRPIITGKFEKMLPKLYIGALVAGNLLLLCMNMERYVTNLRAFYANLFRQSGWGIFPYFAIAMTAFLVIEYVRLAINKAGKPDEANFFDITLLIGYILIVIAVSYGRGDSLNENLGDSGNRVLLQVVPLVVMTFACLFTKLSQILLALTLDEC